MSQYDVPVLWSPDTRLHDPRNEVWVGVPTVGTETAARVDAILEALDGPGFPLVEVRPPADASGARRRPRRRARRVPGHRRRPLGRRPVRRPGRPGPGRALPVPDARDDGRAPGPAGGGDPRRRRPLRLRHDDAGRPGHLRRRARRGRLRRRRGRAGLGRRPAGLRALPPARATTRPRPATAAPATSTTPPSPPRRSGPAARRRSGSSTSTPTRATAPPRSSTTAPTCSTARCTSTRARAGSRTSSGTPTRPAPVRARARPATCRCPRAPATSRGSRPSPSSPTGSSGCDALVVSLGVDAAADDPESPLQVTADGYREAGRLLGATGLPAVAVQEGGYHLPTLGGLVAAYLEGHAQASHRARGDDSGRHRRPLLPLHG